MSEDWWAVVIGFAVMALVLVGAVTPAMVKF